MNIAAHFFLGFFVGYGAMSFLLDMVKLFFIWKDR